MEGAARASRESQSRIKAIRVRAKGDETPPQNQDERKPTCPRGTKGVRAHPVSLGSYGARTRGLTLNR